MGRIKTRTIKAASRDLYEKHGEELTTDFQKNKKVVDERLNTSSKKLRNIVAGYTARLKKSEDK